MKANRKLSAVVTLETEEIIVVKGGRRSMRASCPVCRSIVTMIFAEDAARVAGVGTRKVYEWLESGVLHFIEISGGVAICVPSLYTQTDRGRGTAKLCGTGQAGAHTEGAATK